MTSKEFYHSSFHDIQKNLEEIRELKKYIEEKEYEISNLQSMSRKTT